MGIRSGYHPLTELLVVCLQQDPVALPHCLFSLQCKASCPAHCRHLINLCTFAQRLRDWNNGLKLPPSFKFHWHVHDSFSSRICSCCSFLGGGVCWWTLRDDYVRQREDCSHPGILSSATLGDSLGLCCTPGSLIQYSISRVPWKCRKCFLQISGLWSFPHTNQMLWSFMYRINWKLFHFLVLKRLDIILWPCLWKGNACLGLFTKSN